MYRAILSFSMLVIFCMKFEAQTHKVQLTFEPVCAINLPAPWTTFIDEDYEDYNQYVSDDAIYKTARGFYGTFHYPAKKNKSFTFEINIKFIEEPIVNIENQVNLNDISFTEINRQFYKDAFLITQGRSFENCGWGGKVEKDSTWELQCAKKITRDFIVTIDCSIYEVEQGEGEKVIELAKQILDNIKPIDYAEWDNLRHYPITQNYIDSLCRIERTKKEIVLKEYIQNVMICNGRNYILYLFEIEDTDSIQDLSDDQFALWLFNDRLEKLMSSYRNPYDHKLRTGYTYTKYFDMARKIYDAPLNLKELLSAMHQPDSNSFLCRFIEMDYPYLFEKSNKKRKLTPQTSIQGAQLIYEYDHTRYDFPFLGDFNEKLSDMINQDFPFEGKITNFPEYITKIGEGTDTATYYYRAHLEGNIGYEHLYEFKLENKNWENKKIDLPFTPIDTSKSTYREALVLQTSDYVPIRGNNGDSLYFFSTEDPGHTWFDLNLLPAYDENYIMVFRFKSYNNYTNKSTYQKIRHYGHLINQKNIHEHYKAHLLKTNFPENSHDPKELEKWKNDNGYIQLNDTTFIEDDQYNRHFDEFLHPQLRLYVSNVYTGNIDGIPGDEIFCLSASAGKIVEVQCYTTIDGKIVEIPQEKAIPFIEAYNDVQQFLADTRVGNYEMTGWSEISKQGKKPSPLIWILASGALLTGGFLFARRKKYALN